MSSLPTRTDISGTPSKATLQTALSAVYDFMAQRFAFGTTGAGAATGAELLAARQSLGIGSMGLRNRVINGYGQVQQRAAATLTTTYGYGAADRMLAAITGGATGVSGSVGVLGLGLGLVGASWTNGAAAIQHRIAQKDVGDMTSRVVTMSGKVYHDFGAARTVILAIVKAGALDDFSGAGTVLATGTVVAVSGSVTPFSLSYTMGSSDAGAGIALFAYDNAINTVVNKNFVVTELMLELGSIALAAITFDQRPYAFEKALCRDTCRVVPALTFIASGTNRTGGTAQYLLMPIAIGMRASPAISYAGALPSVFAGDTSGLLTALTADNNGMASSTSAAAGSVGQGVAVITGSVTTLSCDL
jgi:hypothetical protein